MSERVLVAYASKNGSTAEIAATIAEELRAVGMEVDLTEVTSIRELDQYRTVVLGSAVYIGRWRPEARRFLKRHHVELSERDVWLFSSGPIGEQEPGAERWTVPRIVTELGPKIGIHEHVVFGGRVPAEPSNFVERAIARDTPKELRDLRNWDEIRHWAHHIALSTAALTTAA
jgi:menaquinone-dependent protoporphyrinogen oxidase